MILNRISFLLDRTTVAFIAIPLIFLVFFLILPLLWVFVEALDPRAVEVFRIDPEFYFTTRVSKPPIDFRELPDGKILVTIRGYDLGVIANSMLNAAFVTVCSVLLGLLIAYFLAKYEFPGRRALLIMATIPMLVVPFVQAYVIKKVLQPDPTAGTLNWILNFLGLNVVVKVEGLAAVALAQILAFFPIAYLNIYAALTRIDPSLEEQAENLGARGVRLARTVTLPLATPGIAAGAALVFIFALDDVGAPIVFQEYPAARKLLSYQVYSNFIEATTGELSPAAAFLALVLLALSITAFLGIRKYVSLRYYAMMIRQARPRLVRPSAPTLLFIYLVIVPIVLIAMVPQLGSIALALSRSWGGAPLPTGLELRRVGEVLLDPINSRAVYNSLFYALSAVAIMVFMSLSIGYVTTRLPLRVLNSLDVLATVPIAIPGLVVALGYFFFLRSLFRDTALDPWTDPAIPIILAFSIRKLPFVVRAVYAAFQQLHVSLEEAALNLGAGRLRVLADISLPLIKSGVAAGALMGFVYAVSEVSVSVTLGGLKGVGIDHRAPITKLMLEGLQTVGGVYTSAALGFYLLMMQIAAVLVVTQVLKQRFGFTI